MQITESGKQNTTAITKKLCDTFGLCSYIDADGNECLETLELTSPAESITLTDIIGDLSNATEPKIENAFCQPAVNYLYNVASGKYGRRMEVTNIDAAAWQSAYTPGMLDADGETVWNMCKLVYDKIKVITACPSEFSDQPCIGDYTTALNYLKRKISYMTKIKLPPLTIAYSKGKDYNIFKHVMVQLPKFTNNVSAECIIEQITKSKATGTVKLNLILLGDTENAYYDTSYSTNELQDGATLTDQAIIDQ
jgi:hypothetical protein